MSYDLNLKWTNAKHAALDVERVIHAIREQLENGVVPRATIKNLKEQVRSLEFMIKMYDAARKDSERGS